LGDEALELAQLNGGGVLYEVVAVLLGVLQGNGQDDAKVFEIIKEVLGVGHTEALQGDRFGGRRVIDSEKFGGWLLVVRPVVVQAR